MNEDSTQVAYAGGYFPARDVKDGFQEQKEILSQLSDKLDEYFALRNLSTRD